MRHAAAYLRVSSQDQADNLTHEAQRDSIRAWAEASGVEITQWFEDLGIPGATPFEARPGGAALLAAAARDRHDRDFDEVICYRLDRFARDHIEAGLAIRRLSANRIAVGSVSESFDETPFGAWARDTMLRFAELEKQIIAQRTAEGRRGKVRKGELYHASVVPFGYRRAGKLLEPDGETAAIIKRIFELSASGSGVAAIAAPLDADGILSPLSAARPGRYGGWSPGTIAKLIRAPRYKGEAVYGADRVPMECPSIVDAALWQRANDAMTRRGQMSARNTKRPALLQKLAFCSDCGAAITFETHKTSRGIHVYSCARRRKHGRKIQHAGPLYHRSDVLEPTVLGMVQGILDDPADAVARVELLTERHLQSLDSKEAQFAEVGRKLVALEERAARVHDSYEEGLYDRGERDRRLQRINADRNALEQERAELGWLTRQSEMMKAEAREFVEWLESLRPPVRIDELPREEQRAMLERVIEKVWIGADGEVVVEGVVGSPQC
ncbi:MAG: recombinase family protein [Dehalococcoidia bacterium]